MQSTEQTINIAQWQDKTRQMDYFLQVLGRTDTLIYTPKNRNRRAGARRDLSWL